MRLKDLDGVEIMAMAVVAGVLLFAVVLASHHQPTTTERASLQRIADHLTHGCGECGDQ
jgi:hypothetical protein